MNVKRKRKKIQTAQENQKGIYHAIEGGGNFKNMTKTEPMKKNIKNMTALKLKLLYGRV